MPLKSGPPRECTSEAPCGVAIGPFRNANNGQQVVYHAVYIDRLVGTRGPQAPAIFSRKLSGMFKHQISHAPQTRSFNHNLSTKFVRHVQTPAFSHHSRKVLKAWPVYPKVSRGFYFCLPYRECVASRIQSCTSQPKRSLVFVCQFNIGRQHFSG